MLFLELALILLLILLNGFFAASEISLIALRKSRVRHLVKSGNPKAPRVQKLQEEPERFLATIQTGVTLIGTLAATLGGVIAIERIEPVFSALPFDFTRKAAEPLAVGVVVSLISYFTLVFGELVPKSLAIRYSEQIAFATSVPVDILSRLFRWILRMLTASNNFVLGPFVDSDQQEPSLRIGRRGEVSHP